MIPETQAVTLADRDMWAHRALTAEQRAAELAAVVERVRAADSASSSWDHFGHLVMDILATAPADVLREHDTKVLAEEREPSEAARLDERHGRAAS